MDRDQLSEYARHILLPEIGKKGQEKLFQSKVLIIGLGGLGCPALTYLQRAGVMLTIIDPDSVDLSNLPRQILYRPEDQGRPKVEIACQHFDQRRIHAIHASFEDSTDCHNLIRDHDVILDCSDDFELRYLINRLAYTYQKPLISAAVNTFDGYILFFDFPQSPCYACVFDPEKKGIKANCRGGGVFSPITGLLGILQASECLKYLTEIPYLNNMMTINLLTNKSRLISVPSLNGCPICGQ